MRPRRPILIVHGDAKTRRLVHRILGATFAPVRAVADLDEAAPDLAEVPPFLVVAEQAQLASERGQSLLAQGRDGQGPACLVLLEDGDVDLGMLASGSLTNLLTNPLPLFAEDLTITALKLLHRDIFGLEKYLSWGVEAEVHDLADPGERPDLVTAIGGHVEAAGLGSRVAHHASLIADELLSNAAHSTSGSVRLRYACDGRYLAIEVSDPAGDLRRETIMRSLTKAISRGIGKIEMRGRGAGIGLAAVYGACNHLVFNLAPGRRTEVIGLIDVRFRPAELGTTTPSFGLFWDRGSE